MNAITAHGKRGARESGMTMLELLLVLSMLLVALLAISQALGASMGLTNTNRESALAMDGLQLQLEIMSGADDFGELFALYNDDPGDDPGGVAPGSRFQVPGLRATADDPDGLVGEIVFPTVVEAGVQELREDVVDPDLGMPRDLDGDGDVDGEDCAEDYVLLPVTLRVRFRGRSGPRELEVHTLLANR